MMPPPTFFTCPRCGSRSGHPKDIEHGYCGECHDFTGTTTYSLQDIASAEQASFERGYQAGEASMQQTFDIRWSADMRAIKRWQAAHPGNDLTWPDHADLVVWLMEQLDNFTTG